MPVDLLLRSQWLGHEINAMVGASLVSWCPCSASMAIQPSLGVRGMSKLQPGVETAPTIPHPRQAQTFVVTS